MYLESEENKQEEKQNVEGETQIEETERKNLTCPECEKAFQDMRGLTSHARNRHDLSKEELKILIKKDERRITIWEVLGGAGAVILAFLTLGKKH